MSQSCLNKCVDVGGEGGGLPQTIFSIIYWDVPDNVSRQFGDNSFLRPSKTNEILIKQYNNFLTLLLLPANQ